MPSFIEADAAERAAAARPMPPFSDEPMSRR